MSPILAVLFAFASGAFATLWLDGEVRPLGRSWPLAVLSALAMANALLHATP